MPSRAGIFSFLYAAAMVGAFVAFIPVLTLIVPQRVTGLSGTDDLQFLSLLLLCGAVMAGAANIVAGFVSDAVFQRSGHRRALIVLGLVCVLGSFVLLAGARTKGGLLLAVLVFQFSVNVLLAPLTALMVDYVPDRQKGRVAGWLGLALPLGNAAVSIVAQVPGLAGQFLALSALVVALTLPLLWFWPVPGEPIGAACVGLVDALRPSHAKLDFVRAWAARFLVQFAAAGMIYYLYYYVSGFVVFDHVAGPAQVAGAIGHLSLIFAALSVCGGLAAGFLSDSLDRRPLVLSACAMMVGLALLMLALVHDWLWVMFGYGVFAAGLSGFLSLDSALVAQLVVHQRRPATLLGVMNLTNTLPAVIAPMFALMAHDGERASQNILLLLFAASCAAILAGYCILTIRSVR